MPPPSPMSEKECILAGLFTFWSTQNHPPIYLPSNASHRRKISQKCDHSYTTATDWTGNDNQTPQQQKMRTHQRGSMQKEKKNTRLNINQQFYFVDHFGGR